MASNPGNYLITIKDSINQTFISAITRLIKDNHVRSIRAFCESINIHPSTINDIKTGRRSVTLEMLINTSNTYKINKLWFFNESDIFYTAPAHPNPPLPYLNNTPAENNPEIIASGYADKNSEYFKAVTKAADQEQNYEQKRESQVYLVHHEPEVRDSEQDYVEFLKQNNPFFLLPETRTPLQFVFQIMSDEMSDTLLKGDAVFAVLVAHSEPIKPGKLYMVVTSRDKLIGRITGIINNTLEIKFDNDTLFPPVIMESSLIICLFEIMGFYRTDVNQGLKQKELIQAYKELLKAKGINL